MNLRFSLRNRYFYTAAPSLGTAWHSTNPPKALLRPPLKRDSAEEYRLVQYMDNLGSWSCPCLLDEALSFTANKVSRSADFGKVHYIRFFIYISHLYGRHSRSLQKIQGQLSTCFHPRNQTFRKLFRTFTAKFVFMEKTLSTLIYKNGTPGHVHYLSYTPLHE